MILTVLIVTFSLSDAYAHDNTIYPITEIYQGYVYWDLKDSKGNIYSWEMPIDEYENKIKFNYYNTDYKNKLFLKNSNNNEEFTVQDHRDYLTYSFDNIIDDVYDNSYDDGDFIYEVWFIVSQLTTYQTDVTTESEGRYPLETFTRGGGDCEDLVILIADMLRSSSHTKDWEFQFVYLDSGNPNYPQTMNHVILHVYDGTYEYYIEATGEPSWDYYLDGVTGWWYDIPSSFNR